MRANEEGGTSSAFDIRDQASPHLTTWMNHTSGSTLPAAQGGETVFDLMSRIQLRELQRRVPPDPAPGRDRAAITHHFREGRRRESRLLREPIGEWWLDEQ